MPASNQLTKVDVIPRSSGQLNRPSQMSVLANGDIFIAEMWSGKVKLYSASTKQVTEVGTVEGLYRDNSGPEGAGVENGLLGLAADPNYATTHWIYVFFSHLISNNSHSAGDGGVREHEHVLRRYSVVNGQLASPKDLLSMPRQSARHAAGGLAFDKNTGDLYLTTGDDTFPSSDKTIYGGRNEASDFLNSLRSSANTNDLRGKTLRIHPLPFPDTENPGMGPGKAYSIPAGNLFPEGTAKTRPEIYTMGHRNPYRIEVDPVSGVALIGEVGPDARNTDPNKGTVGYDEFNLVTKAANFGWPFGNGNNLMYTAIADEAFPVGTKYDATALKNKSKYNTGLEDIPAANPALIYYCSSQNAPAPFAAINDNKGGGSAAIAGPYYRYDATSTYATRLPAYFNGKFIIGDWSRSRLWLLELDANKGVKKLENFLTVSKPIDMEIGPNGEFYLLEYANNSGYQGSVNTGAIYKVDFTGTQYETSACTDTYVLPAKSVSLGQNGHKSRFGTMPTKIRLGVTSLVSAPSGAVKGTLYDLKGAKMWEGKVVQGQLRLPKGAQESLALLQFE